MFAWSQLDFSAIPVSISAVSLTGSWQNVYNKRRLQIIPNVQEGKRHQKKIYLAAFVFVPSVFWEKFPTAEVRMISAGTSAGK
jgi:hypothetical protein